MPGVTRSLRDGTGGAPPPDLPPYADWWWRAGFGTRRSLIAAAPDSDLAPGASLHHDCPLGEVLLHPDGAGLTVEVFGFEGSYFGIALTPPAEAASGLRRRHILRLDVALTGDLPQRVYARLNLRAAGHVTTALRELPDTGGPLRRAEFDIAAAGADTVRLDRFWVDLLFEAPRGARIHLAEAVLVRRPRADL